jgi:hypothetical protein
VPELFYPEAAGRGIMGVDRDSRSGDNSARWVSVEKRMPTSGAHTTVKQHGGAAGGLRVGPVCQWKEESVRAVESDRTGPPSGTPAHRGRCLR